MNTHRLTCLAALSAISISAACVGNIGDEGVSGENIDHSTDAAKQSPYERAHEAFNVQDWHGVLSAIGNAPPNTREAHLMLAIAYKNLDQHKGSNNHYRHIRDNIDAQDCDTNAGLAEGLFVKREEATLAVIEYVYNCSCHSHYRAIVGNGYDDRGTAGHLFPNPEVFINNPCIHDARMGADMMSQDIPTKMQAGETYSASITMNNSGRNHWWTGSDLFHLVQVSGEYGVFGPGAAYTDPGEYVKNGESRVFDMTLTAPAEPGIYELQWRMLQQGLGFFGAPTQKVFIEVAAAAAEPLTIYPTDDAWVSQQEPNRNDGTGDRMRLRPNDSGNAKHGYMRFDITGTEGAKSVWLYMRNPSSNGFNVRVDAVADSNWNESKLTWNTRPNGGGKTLSTYAPARDWAVVEVTDLVTGDGPLSVRLRQKDVDDVRSLVSKEGKKKPHIVVMYD